MKTLFIYSLVWYGSYALVSRSSASSAEGKLADLIDQYRGYLAK